MTPTKAVAAAVGAIASILLAFNVHVSEEVQALIITVVTFVVTYLAPKNRRRA